MGAGRPGRVWPPWPIAHVHTPFSQCRGFGNNWKRCINLSLVSAPRFPSRLRTIMTGFGLKLIWAVPSQGEPLGDCRCARSQAHTHTHHALFVVASRVCVLFICLFGFVDLRLSELWRMCCVRWLFSFRKPTGLLAYIEFHERPPRNAIRVAQSFVRVLSKIWEHTLRFPQQSLGIREQSTDVYILPYGMALHIGTAKIKLLDGENVKEHYFTKAEDVKLNHTYETGYIFIKQREVRIFNLQTKGLTIC